MDNKWTERVKARMTELGLTQADLMEPLGVTTRGAVGHYLNGRRQPSLQQMAALSQALRISTDDLLFGDARPLYPYARQRHRKFFTQIPIMGKTTVAPDGLWARTEDTAIPSGWFDFATTDPEALALEIHGGDPKSILRPGCFLVLEPGAQLQAGDYVLAVVKDGSDLIFELLLEEEDSWVVASLITGNKTKITLPFIDEFKIAAILPPTTMRHEKPRASEDVE